jgi:hypothetical protein
MAENTEADLLVQLGMTMTKMNRQLAQAEARFTRTAQKIERDFNAANQRSVERTVGAATTMEGAFTKLGRVAGAVLGVVIGQGILQISANAGKAIKSLADLADQADRVGANLEQYQALQFGFQLAGVDNAAFVQGMEMFTQRIGEAAEGSGELYDLLRENGIALRGVDGELRPVNDLLRDFADLIQQAGSESEQMAMLNDAFGRSGRGLVLALRDGSAGLDAMSVAAEEAGVVLDEGLVRRAAELDDRLDVVKAQAQALMNIFAVYGGESVLGLAAIIEDIRSIGDEVTNLDTILQGNPNAAQLLGLNVIGAMETAGDATEAQAAAAQQLISLYNQLDGTVEETVTQLDRMASEAMALGEELASLTLTRLARDLDAAREGLDAGTISTEEFEARLTDVSAEAVNVLMQLDAIEDITFDGAIAQAGRLALALYDVAMQAATVRANLPTYNPTMPEGGPGTFPVGDNIGGTLNGNSPLAPTSVTIPPNRPGFDWYFPSTGGGRSGGGSPGGGGSAIAQAPEYWDELIDKVREGEQAWAEYNQTVEDGAARMADFFMSILDGSMSAKEAVSALLMELARAQMMKAFLGLSEGGGVAASVFGALGDALSFDGGGYTGAGARTGGIDGKGGFPAILHPNETVIDHTKNGGTGGGQVSVVVRMEGGNLVPVIESVSGSVTARALQGYDRQLPGRVRNINSDRRKL